jgi:hypothetical protein
MPLMSSMTRALTLLGGLVLLAWFAATPRAAQPTFYPDDPIAVFPEPADASAVRPRPASQGFDFVENSFLRPGERVDRRAGNINSIDEVPDSSWFTNRIGATALSLDALRQGPNEAEGPAPGPWKLIAGDAAGVTPGFRIRDAAGQLYFIKVDQPRNPELATGAEIVSTKILHAIGYNVPQNYLASITRDMLDLSEAQITGADGRRRRMTERDLETLLTKAARSADGSYRVIASRAIDGTIIGPFRYYGTVPDDPNDIVPHEHRRELRALRVFSAWLNHMDSRGINSLDTLVPVGSRKVVRHHLLDFGSTLGSAAIAVKSRRSGHSYLWDFGDSMKAMATFGLYLPDWVFIDYPMQLPAVGRFEGDRFEPEEWVPHYPNAAFDNARPDDTFWGARRVMAFSDQAIRAIVETGRYTDPRAIDYLTEVLIKRRDRIGRTWLTNVNPLVDFSVDAAGTMRFSNAAVDAGVADAPREYRVTWATFDNASNTVAPHRGTVAVTAARADMPPSLATGDSAFVRAEIATIHDRYPEWVQPVRVTFRREGAGWKTVGLERLATEDRGPRADYRADPKTNPIERSSGL